MHLPTDKQNKNNTNFFQLCDHLPHYRCLPAFLVDQDRQLFPKKYQTHSKLKFIAKKHETAAFVAADWP